MTKSIGQHNTMVSVAFPDEAERMLAGVAKDCGFPDRSKFLKWCAELGATTKLGKKALAFKVALHQSKQALASTVSAIIVGAAFVLHCQGAEISMRRPRSARKEFQVEANHHG